MNVFAAYATVAGIGGGVAAFISIVALNTLSHITDSGMYAIALMSMAPPTMAVGIAFFIHRTHIAQIGAGLVPRDPRSWPRQGPPELPFAAPPPPGGYTPSGRDER